MPETVNQEPSTKATADQEQKTFTQEELNGIVTDRVKREREKYADYATLKEKADKLDKLEEASKSEIQKMTEKAERLQAELDEIKKAEKVREIRAKVAQETGVPVHLLTGDTEEDCQTQAEAIKAYATPAYPSVRDAGEPSGVPGASAAQEFANWFNNK